MPTTGAQPDIEVVGLVGRAAVANGIYSDTGQLVNGRPKYQQTTWLSTGTWQHRINGPCQLVYDEGAGGVGIWIVTAPNDPGRAFAWIEDDAATPDAVQGGWLVWYCDEDTRIEDGVWLELGKVYWPTPFRVARAEAGPDERAEHESAPVDMDVSPRSRTEHESTPLSRTKTHRTMAADESLDALSTEIQGLEDSVRFLDQTATKETLGRLTRRLSELSSALDETLVQGLTGETPLKTRRQHLRDRVEAQLAMVERKAAAQAAQAIEPDRAQTEPAIRRGLSRSQAGHALSSNESLDALDAKIGGLEERVRDLEPPTIQENLSTLQRQLDELKDELSRTTVRGSVRSLPKEAFVLCLKISQCSLSQTDKWFCAER